MNIQQIVTGPIQENCYLVYNEDTLLIIDPGVGTTLKEMLPI